MANMCYSLTVSLDSLFGPEPHVEKRRAFLAVLGLLTDASAALCRWKGNRYSNPRWRPRQLIWIGLPINLTKTFVA
jgi:hypothetical protein